MRKNYGFGSTADCIYVKITQKEFNKELTKEYTYKVIEVRAREVINKKLPAYMANVYGIFFTSHVLEVREGSVIILFELVLAAYNVLIDYKDLYESIELIKTQCKRLLNIDLENILDDKLMLK